MEEEDLGTPVESESEIATTITLTSLQPLTMAIWVSTTIAVSHLVDLTLCSD